MCALTSLKFAMHGPAESEVFRTEHHTHEDMSHAIFFCVFFSCARAFCCGVCVVLVGVPTKQAVDRAFRTARELAPSIIFIDEFQALFASRDAGGGTG